MLGDREEREFTAHCRHSGETEIRILNRREELRLLLQTNKMPEDANEKESLNFSL